MLSCESQPRGKCYCLSPPVSLLLWQLMKYPIDISPCETSSLTIATWKLLIAKTWLLRSPVVCTVHLEWCYLGDSFPA